MANLLNYDSSQLLGFVLVLIRVWGVLAASPVLGDAAVPQRIKVTTAFVLALVFHPILPDYAVSYRSIGAYLVLVAQELLIGLALGMIGQVLFAAVRVAGEIAGFQMGLSMAGVFDPQTQQQNSIISEMQYVFAILAFLLADGHHVFIQAIVESYRLLPLGAANLSAPVTQAMINLTAGIFTLGFQLGAPLIISLLIINIILGFIARAVPQMNVFVVGSPLTILLGFALMAASLPFFIIALGTLFEMLDDQVITILNLLK